MIKTPIGQRSDPVYDMYCDPDGMPDTGQPNWEKEIVYTLQTIFALCEV